MSVIGHCHACLPTIVTHYAKNEFLRFFLQVVPLHWEIITLRFTATSYIVSCMSSFVRSQCLLFCLIFPISLAIASAAPFRPQSSSRRFTWPYHLTLDCLTFCPKFQTCPFTISICPSLSLPGKALPFSFTYFSYIQNCNLLLNM